MPPQSSLRAFRQAHPLWFLGSVTLGWIFFISTARWLTDEARRTATGAQELLQIGALPVT
jgi:hypothetical protein